MVLTEPGLTAWTVGGNRLYLGFGGVGESGRIERYDPVSRRKEEIYRFPPGGQGFGVGQHSLAVSRDEHAIIASVVPPFTLDILLVDNFR